MNALNFPKFTQKELDGIDAFCADGQRGKRFGYLNVKKYNGTNTVLRGLNGTAKFIGTAKMEVTGDRTVWVVTAIDGEKYRIPEPTEGIDAVLELDFKRKDV